MAMMLPEVISPKVKSAAEQKVFRWFKTDRRTKDWIVLHSLGIESHFNRAYSEMDFLVLAPQLGIFALEVKGGGVKRKSGSWHYTDRFDMNYQSHRSPIDQAKEGMFNVLTYLKKYGENKQLAKLMFGFGLMFPDITFDNDDPDVDQLQFFDVRNRGDIFHYIQKLSTYYQKKNQALFLPIFLPTMDDVKEIAKLLRPDFDLAISIEIKKASSEEEIVHLTSEQYRCIDGLHTNPRVIITGYAGSGKSILALKYLKEKIAAQVNIAYFCFNPDLKEVMQNHIKQELGSSFHEIYDFHSYLSTIVYPDSSLTQVTDNRLKDEDLIFAAADKLGALNKPIFDVIIIDQAQAFLSDGALLVFDLLLKRGLSEGSWFFFGDFEVHQAFGKEISVKKIKKMLNPYTKEVVVFQLTENCRNNPLIIHEANMFGGIKDLFINPTTIYHHPVEYKTFSTESDLINKIINVANNLFQSKLILPQEVTIIDFNPELNQAMKEIKEKKDNKYLKDIQYKVPETMIGLETSIAMIINVDSYEDRYRIYNALLRARTAVFVFETVKAKLARFEIVSETQKRIK
jgi:hypothetical protein